ncbi:MAG: DUF305 domain-containing protein [Rhodococcus sp. (in: high G+C Gram-positive bacteria)]|uniref:DUF305 domain-containing protein n=1 Tax=Rhodococcus sp. TaxID=1831 RepID=UPI003BB7EB30
MLLKKSLAVGVIAVVTTFTLAACGDSGGDRVTPATGSVTATVSASPDTAAVHNQADVMFARQMVLHHSQAVEMSNIIMAKEGIDPRVTELARQITAAQGPEIQQLQTWLTEWGQPTMPTTMPGMPMPSPDMGMPGHDMPMHSTVVPDGNMGGMSGMMSGEDMTALHDAQGAEASRLYLAQMIEHHLGAIAMAQAEIETGQNPGAVAMARSIVETQQQEITTMEDLLASL